MTWIDWGDAPTWLATTGTLATLATIVWQLNRDRKWRNDEIERVSNERKLSQAIKVSSWVIDNHPGTSIIIANNNTDPLYDVVAFIVLQTSERIATDHINDSTSYLNRKKHYVTVHVLPPGTWKIQAYDGWHGMSKFPYSEVSFTDSSGNHWVRRANGSIEELRENALASTGLGFPYLEYGITSLNS